MSIKKGFGIIEIIVALGLFAVVGVTGITMVLHSFTANRLGNEQTVASNLTSSGLEIVKNIKMQNWSNLVPGTYGLKNTAGVWSLSTLPETWDKYTRTITIADSQRDGLGNVVDSGGTADPNTKKVTVTTGWNVGATRNNTVELSEYLTNYSKTISSSGDALIAWGDTTTTPKWNTYTNTTDIFGTKSNLVAGESARNMIVKTSPTKSEAIAAYTSATGVLHVQCYNGTTWSEDFTVAVGGTGTTRRFDIGFEKTTGDAMIVYSTNTTTTNELAYRTKAGSSGCGAANWSAATNLNPVRTSGRVHWVRLESDPRSGQNILGLAWADEQSDLSAMFWDGTAWVNEPTAVSETSLEIIAVGQDIETFDITYESLSGNFMLVWGRIVGPNINGARYRVCTGGTATCTWGAVTTPPTFTDDVTNLDISSNPASNEIVFASIGDNQSDLQVGYWNGSAWTNTANRDTSVTNPFAGSQKVATGWLKSGATTRSLVTYDDQGSGRINWYIGNAGSFTAQTDFLQTPAFSNNQGYYKIVMDPKNSDRLMFAVADNSNDLFAKRLVMNATPTFTWTNSDGSAALELNLSQNRAGPFSLDYWRN